MKLSKLLLSHKKKYQRYFGRVLFLEQYHDLSHQGRVGNGINVSRFKGLQGRKQNFAEGVISKGTSHLRKQRSHATSKSDKENKQRETARGVPNLIKSRLYLRTTNLTIEYMNKLKRSFNFNLREVITIFLNISRFDIFS